MNSSELDTFDGATWFRLSVEADNSDGRVVLGDYDSREEAQEAFDHSAYADTGARFMITKMYGRA